MNYIHLIIKHIFSLVIIFNAQPRVFASVTSSRIVRTKYGELSGIVSSPSDRLDAVEIFRGVPYALPPVGHLRFMPPVSGAQWSGVKVADRFSPVCPQNLPPPARGNNTNATIRGRLDYLYRLVPYLANQSEDCLYLNIYAPAQGKRSVLLLQFLPCVLTAYSIGISWCFQTAPFLIKLRRV